MTESVTQAQDKMTSQISDKQKRVVVAGGGPVGTLTAILLKRRGFHVDLYEAATDIRAQEAASGRSINLALSFRGISALERAGVGDVIDTLGVVVHSRYIHAMNGKQYSLPYGKGRYLYSIGRADLNKSLLTIAENMHVGLHFGQKLTRADASIPTATFKGKNGQVTTVNNAKVLLGCDGAYSAVRMNMLKNRMDFSQSYIELGYKELCIPPTSSGEYALKPNHIHLWPRQDFVLLALPNLDKSFTGTLIMPFADYDKITAGDDVVKFFDKYFKDLIPLVGKKSLKESFFAFPPLPMVTVRCKPYHYKDKAVLLGDAAHAVIPFAGQGLNCGLEDTLVFDELMAECGDDFSKVLPKFSEARMPPCNELANLAMYNYMEMRSGVASPSFLLQKKIGDILHYFLPDTYIPRFTMVTFTRIAYDEIARRARKQDNAMSSGLLAFGLSALAVAVFSLGKMCAEVDVWNPGAIQYFTQQVSNFYM